MHSYSNQHLTRISRLDVATFCFVSKRFSRRKDFPKRLSLSNSPSRTTTTQERHSGDHGHPETTRASGRRPSFLPEPGYYLAEGRSFLPSGNLLRLLFIHICRHGRTTAARRTGRVLPERTTAPGKSALRISPHARYWPFESVCI